MVPTIRWALHVGFITCVLLVSGRGDRKAHSQDVQSRVRGSQYGVCAHLARGDEHQLLRKELKGMRRAGLGWVRTDFKRDIVEKSQGEWNFRPFDRTVRATEKAGVQLLTSLSYHDVPPSDKTCGSDCISPGRRTGPRIAYRKNK